MNNKKVVLLRGINVGGHKKFTKAEQLKTLTNLNVDNPKVYLHTGNWIFNNTESNRVLARNIEAAILKTQGWEIPLLVLNASEIKQIFNACPFPEAVKVKSYFVLLQNSPLAEEISEVKKINIPGEEFHITDRCIYFYPEKGAGRAKLSTNFFEKKLNVAATARNYNTMLKIIELTTS